MKSLNSEVWVVDIPKGSTIFENMINLNQEFPNIIIDTNDFLNLSMARTTDYSRKVIGWGDVPPTCGNGLKIGMIDGGINIKHKALIGQDIKYKNFIKKGRKAVAFDHGTAIATMLIGKAISTKISGGLLPGAKLYAAGIFEQRKGKNIGNLASLFRAIEWMSVKQVHVVNLSIAGGLNKIMKMVISRASNNGIIIVAAAGNNGPYAEPAWPAAHDNVIAVTAIDRKGKIYNWANQGEYIDFAAPGVDIPTFTNKGAKIQSGTSFATPFITAVVGIHLLSGFPPDLKKIKKSMRQFTKDLSGKTHDVTFGYGLVRVKAGCK